MLFSFHYKNDIDYKCKIIYIKIKYKFLPYFGINYVCKVDTKIAHIHVDKLY